MSCNMYIIYLNKYCLNQYVLYSPAQIYIKVKKSGVKHPTKWNKTRKYREKCSASHRGRNLLRRFVGAPIVQAVKWVKRLGT